MWFGLDVEFLWGRNRMSFPADRGFRALIVDDDELSRDVAASLLRKLGATEIIEASSGRSAIAWADTDPGALDLILCDLRMPEVDGLETLDALALRSYPRMFVLTSGADRRTVRAAASAASRVGPDRLRVVNKPVTLEKMQGIVDGLFERSVQDEPSWDVLQKAPPDCSTDMVRGLALGEFIPLFVPKRHLATDRVDSVEALWRWRHARYGILSPESFVSVAESVGLIGELFLTIFGEAVAHCAAWRQKGLRLGVSINVPPGVLTSRDLPRRLEEIVTLHGVAAHQITLEVAESAWLQERDHAREVLTRLRLRGFGLSIDDFGAGFSTVKQLLDAPFNEMKLDPSFLQLAPDDVETAIALSSYLSVARQLDMTIVMQGVETMAQFDYAAGLGCDSVQGSMIGPPLMADAFEEWLTAHSSSMCNLA